MADLHYYCKTTLQMILRISYRIIDLAQMIPITKAIGFEYMWKLLIYH
jgi:hypothetical protein